jgi:hypothetical protein
MRNRVTPLFPIGVAPARAAECIGVRRAVIDAAIHAGELVVYQKGLKRRILVEDLTAWVRKTWTGDRRVPVPPKRKK